MCGNNYSNLTNLRRVNHISSGLHDNTMIDQQKVATRTCPKCGTLVQEDFVFCPGCGTDLLTACPECHRAVEVQWTNCAFCGAALTTS